MYWKFKLPLIIIMVLILGFIVYKGVTVFRDRETEKTDSQVAEQAATPVQIQDTEEQPPLVISKTDAVPAPKAFDIKEIDDSKQPQAPVAASGGNLAPIPPPPAANSSDLKPLDKPSAVQQTAEPLSKPLASQKVANPPSKKVPQPVVIQPAIPQAQKTEKPIAVAPKTPVAPAAPALDLNATLNEAIQLAKQKKRLQARKLAQGILNAPGVKEYDSTWRLAAQIISDINRDFSFSTLPCPEKTSYTIQEGDVLVRIAHRQKVSLLAIYAMNPGIKPRTLWVGRKIRYIDGNWSIKVSKSNFILTLYRNGELFRVYKVGIGKDDRTPVGTFRIKDKVMNPAWDSPEGRILPNDPKNILGTRWMGLLATGNTSDQLIGYGIHGTTLPQTVGTPSSAGCVRLKNQDVEDLYTYIPEPDSAIVPVLIVE